MSPHATIPDSLRGYFWEYDPEGLSLERNRHTIVLRLLQAGGLDAVRWLRENVGDGEIRALLTRRRGRGIPPPRLRFWALMLDLPREQVDSWIAAGRANPWQQRTRV